MQITQGGGKLRGRTGHSDGSFYASQIICILLLCLRGNYQSTEHLFLAAGKQIKNLLLHPAQFRALPDVQLVSLAPTPLLQAGRSFYQGGATFYQRVHSPV